MRTLAAATAKRSRASRAPASTGEGREEEDDEKEEEANERAETGPVAAAAAARPRRATVEEAAPTGACSALKTADETKSLVRPIRGEATNRPFCFFFFFC